jgi:hypothetical protein
MAFPGLGHWNSQCFHHLVVRGTGVQARQDDDDLMIPPVVIHMHSGFGTGFEKDIYWSAWICICFHIVS